MNQLKPRMLILMFTELAREPRAMRQVRAFRRDFEVITVGAGSSPFSDVQHIEIPTEVPVTFFLRAWRYAWRTIFWRLRAYANFEKLRPQVKWAYDRLRSEQWDVVIAHDVQTAYLANRLRARRGLLIDLHEYAPRQYEHSEQWVREVAPYHRWICSTQVSRADRIITVGAGIAAEYKRNFGFVADVIVNATPFAELSPAEVGTPIRLVHSGIAAPARKLEIMLEGLCATGLPITLDLLLVEPEGSTYIQELQDLVGDDPRVRFLPAVPYEQLVETLNQYDVGVSIIAPTTFNHEWSLPNKFFDYVQARLGVIVGPSPEMTRYVEDFGLGAITGGFEPADFAALLTKLNVEEVASWKHASGVHAMELSGERQMELLRNIVAQMLVPAEQQI